MATGSGAGRLSKIPAHTPYLYGALATQNCLPWVSRRGSADEEPETEGPQDYQTGNQNA